MRASGIREHVPMHPTALAEEGRADLTIEEVRGCEVESAGLVQIPSA